MHVRRYLPLACCLLSTLSLPAWSLEIEWTRMTGQFQSECAPLVADLNGDGDEEILAVTMGGQLLLWKKDGSAIGEGQDGAVTQLPEGRWTTTPVRVRNGDNGQIVVDREEGVRHLFSW